MAKTNPEPSEQDPSDSPVPETTEEENEEIDEEDEEYSDEEEAFQEALVLVVQGYPEMAKAVTTLEKTLFSALRGLVVLMSDVVEVSTPIESIPERDRAAFEVTRKETRDRLLKTLSGMKQGLGVK